MRMETAEKLAALEEQYWGRMEGQELTGKTRERYKQWAANKTLDPSETPALTKGASKHHSKHRKRDRDRDQTDTYQHDGGATTPGPGILKKAGERESLAKPKFDYTSLEEGTAASTHKGRSRSRSKKKKDKKEKEKEEKKKRGEVSPLAYGDPRQQIYEAKYEKYLANKKAKKEW